jgi:hypothetical protein
MEAIVGVRRWRGRAVLAAAGLLGVLALGCGDELHIALPPAETRWSRDFETQGLDDHVYALAFYDGDLVAGGRFATAGGRPASAVARWDGAGWSDLGGGLQRQPCGLGCGPWVQALVVYQGGLVAGGSFTHSGSTTFANVGRWNGAAWEALGAGFDDAVLCLAVYDGVLIAGGLFEHSGGDTVSHLAFWDGAAWRALAGGVDGPVRALLVHEGRLVAAGDFLFAGGGSARRIATWNGSTWGRLAEGLPGVVRALTVHEHELTAGGELGGTGNVSRWDGSAWHLLGLPQASVHALAPFGTDLVAGGLLADPYTGRDVHLLRWDGSRWTPLGGGLDRPVMALAVQGDTLWVGGWFRQAGGIASHHLARWID